MGEPARLISIPLPTEKEKNKKKEIFLLILVSFSLGVVSYLSYDWFIFSKNHIETNNAYIESDIYHVQSRIMGYVKEVLVSEDQSVQKSTQLLQLDTTDVEIEKNVKAARFKKAQTDLNRAQKLYQSQLISKSDYENAEAMTSMAEADHQGSLLKEKYMKVISPTDGIIAKTYIKPGQFIQPGQNLFTIVTNKKFWIKANYKETQIKSIHPNQEVKIEIDAYPGVEFVGHVLGIYPSSGAVTSLIPAENATGNFTKIVQRVPVKISIEAKEGYTLRPGMSVITSINTESHKK